MLTLTPLTILKQLEQVLEPVNPMPVAFLYKFKTKALGFQRGL
jgi:hypothetical protein